jgi:hypothetical protein
MPNIPASAVRNPRPAKGALALLCSGVLVCGGCFAAKRPAPSLGAVTLAHPVTPQVTQISLNDVPNFPAEAPEPAPTLAPPRKAPAKPHVPAAPVREPAVANDNSEPIIAPEFTDAQMEEEKAAVQQSLDVANRNVGLTKEMTLNATQQDLVSKILSFEDSAREAMKNKDWQRARIQAKKAEVLSQEFAPKQ